MDRFEKEVTLRVAYQISEDVEAYPVKELFWAMDRFYYDSAEIDECAREQRFEATQRIAYHLDARGVPVRDPRLPSTFVPRS